jgi:AcrR family transcriptional regulator
MRWAGQRERRRADVVAAALAAIERHGPDVSIEEISAAAGVARPQLYRHFDDKADLQTAICEAIGAALVAELQPALRPRESAQEAVDAGIAIQLRWIVEHQNLYRFATGYAAAASISTSAAVRTAIATRIVELFDFYLGKFGVCLRYTEVTAFGLVGMVEAAAARWLDKPGDLTLDELSSYLAARAWTMISEPLLDIAQFRLVPDKALPLDGEVARG